MAVADGVSADARWCGRDGRSRAAAREGGVTLSKSLFGGWASGVNRLKKASALRKGGCAQSTKRLRLVAP